MRAARRVGLVLLASCGVAAPSNAPDAAPPIETAVAASPCAPGWWAQDDGRCQPAGVAPSACVAGFVPDVDLGCAPVVTPTDCPAGQVAWLGETVCHEIVDCGDGPWGAIPIDAATIFVDASYAGGASDGSRDRPWRTIQAGVDHAAPDAVVAVAAGDYAERVRVMDHPVRLWGRCPRLVRVVAVPVDADDGSVFVTRVFGTEIHAVAFTGRVDTPLTMTTGLLDGVLASVPLDVQSNAPATALVVRRSLFETGVDVSGDAWIDQSIARRPNGSGTQAIGVDLNGRCIVQASIVEGATDAILCTDGRVDVVGSLVRDTAEGILFSGQAARGTISSSVFERIDGNVVAVRGVADVRVASTTIRGAGGAAIFTDLGAKSVSAVDLSARIAVAGARISEVACAICLNSGGLATAVGVFASDFPADPNAFAAISVSAVNGISDGAAFAVNLDLAGSVVDGAPGVGVLVEDATATVVGSVVRATHALADGSYGDGIDLARYRGAASVGVVDSRIEASVRAGIAGFGASATLAGVTFVDDRIDIDAESNGRTDATFVDEGRNVCIAAGTPLPCAAQSTGLAPPPPEAAH